MAVKIFLQEMDNLDNHSISELLLLSKQPKHLLHAYKEIRQEVSFLATLNNPFLTELCGVRTSPYMCLLLELAPKKSLRSMLKEYKECGLTLEPLTLKNTALQVCMGSILPTKFCGSIKVVNAYQACLPDDLYLL